jgi:hypothetical protein
MVNLNIKRIVFSISETEFKSCSPCELNGNHISAGTKFINNDK